jgi:hypothetical protein
MEKPSALLPLEPADQFSNGQRPVDVGLRRLFDGQQIPPERENGHPNPPADIF